MNQVIRCPKCNTSLRLPANTPVVSGRCPRCKEPLQLAAEPVGQPVHRDAVQQIAQPPQARLEIASTVAPAAVNTASAGGYGAPQQANFVAADDGQPDLQATLRSTYSSIQSAIGSDDNVAAAVAGAIMKNGTQGTQVNAAIAAILGVILTIGLYIFALPFHGTFAGSLLYHRGFIPIVIMLLSFWSLSMLALKSLAMRKQRSAFRLDLLPESIDVEINPENAVEFQRHLVQFEKRFSKSFVIRRISRCLAHFQSRRCAKELVSFLQTQSEIDAHSVYSSYKLVKVCIWAIPILGFVGTVLGIGSAVGGFSATIAGAGELDSIKDSLGSVTTGLALAFDTTLLALVMSIFVMFPASHVQKAEEDFLNKVDDFCNQHLLRRLNDHSANRASATAEVASLLDRVLAKHQRRWLEMSEQNVLAITKQVQATWKIAQQQSQTENERLVESVRSSLTETVDQSRAIVARVNEFQRHQAQSFSSSMSSIANASHALGEQLDQIKPVCERTEGDLENLLRQQQTFVETASDQISQVSRAAATVSEGLQHASEQLSNIGQVDLPAEIRNELGMARTCNAELLKAIQALNEQLERRSHFNGSKQKGLLPRLFGRDAIAAT